MLTNVGHHILIAKRHKYQIDNPQCGATICVCSKNSVKTSVTRKNIRPEDFMAAHDNATRKIEATYTRRKEPAEQRCWEIEARAEQQRQLQRKKDAEDFTNNQIFRLGNHDEEIIVKVSSVMTSITTRQDAGHLRVWQ